MAEFGIKTLKNNVLKAKRAPPLLIFIAARFMSRAMWCLNFEYCLHKSFKDCFSYGCDGRNDINAYLNVYDCIFNIK